MTLTHAASLLILLLQPARFEKTLYRLILNKCFRWHRRQHGSVIDNIVDCLLHWGCKNERDKKYAWRAFGNDADL